MKPAVVVYQRLFGKYPRWSIDIEFPLWGEVFKSDTTYTGSEALSIADQIAAAIGAKVRVEE